MLCSVKYEGVSPPLLEPEHATPAPANDATKQPVVSAAAIASLQQIADRFRGLKCSTRASVMIAGREIILPVPDCVAATAPREIVLDGVPVMWPWDWDVSEELLEMARRDERFTGSRSVATSVCSIIATGQELRLKSSES